MHYRSSLALFAACTLFAAAPVLAEGDGSGSTPDQVASAYDPTADYQVGADAYATGNFAAAAKAFRKIVAAVPKNPHANYLLGASLMAQGDFARAVRPFETALRYDEKMIDARRDLGIAQATLGKSEKATEQLAALKALQEACGGICANAAKITDGIARIEAAIAAGPQAQGWVEPEIRLASAGPPEDRGGAAVAHL